ncbi:MAG: DUF2905 domain-containing protein [Candidatus Latescibacterota bacterium]|nr:MAG: DUF2905 domain-containing protein [Candidatus Latescibacterota bacterium]
MEQIGKFIVLIGVILIVVGLAISVFDRIPLLGRLPGDIHIKRGNFHFYFPVVTSIAISATLTLLFWLFTRFIKR